MSLALVLPLFLFLFGCHISAQGFQIQTLQVPDSRPEFAEDDYNPVPLLELHAPVVHRKRKQSENRAGGGGYQKGKFIKCSHNCKGWPNQECQVNNNILTSAKRSLFLSRRECPFNMDTGLSHHVFIHMTQMDRFTQIILSKKQAFDVKN